MQVGQKQLFHSEPVGFMDNTLWQFSGRGDSHDIVTMQQSHTELKHSNWSTLKWLSSSLYMYLYCIRGTPRRPTERLRRCSSTIRWLTVWWMPGLRRWLPQKAVWVFLAGGMLHPRRQRWSWALWRWRKLIQLPSPSRWPCRSLPGGWRWPWSTRFSFLKRWRPLFGDCVHIVWCAHETACTCTLSLIYCT